MTSKPLQPVSDSGGTETARRAEGAPAAGAGPVLVISGLDLGDDSFDSDRGSWNVTRARRDCEAGKYRPYAFEVDEVFQNNQLVEVDEAKVAAFAAADLATFPPLIFVVEDNRLWLIEGHHRLHALHRRHVRECTGYVIEEPDGVRYRVYFNGERIAPWTR